MKTTKLTRVQFNNKLREEVAAALTNVFAVDLQEVLKNNNTKLYGLCIREYEDSSIAPIFYINDYYKDYYMGRLLPDIVRELVANISNYVGNTEVTDKIDIVDSYSDYEEMKSKIVIKLINYDNNLELLKDTPHIKYLDLAITFGIVAIQDSEGIGLALVKNNFLSIWNVTVNDLLRVAIPNTRRILGFTINDLSNMLCNTFNIAKEDLGNPEDIDNNPMVVVSSKSGLYGSASLLYKDLWKHIADNLNSDLILLPSSIHEIIAIRFVKDLDKYELYSMVKAVNTEVVSNDEILSNNVYIYERVNNTLSLLN